MICWEHRTQSSNVWNSKKIFLIEHPGDTIMCLIFKLSYHVTWVAHTFSISAHPHPHDHCTTASSRLTERLKLHQTSQFWKLKYYFCLGSRSVPGISMPASDLRLIYFSICTIHASTHLTAQEKEAARRTPRPREMKLWLPFREMHRAKPEGEARETSDVFFTCSQNAGSKQMDGREKPWEFSPFYLESGIMTWAGHRRDHISRCLGLPN